MYLTEALMFQSYMELSKVTVGYGSIHLFLMQLLIRPSYMTEVLQRMYEEATISSSDDSN